MSDKQKIESSLGRVLALRTGDWLLPHVEDWHEKSYGKGRVTPGWVHASELDGSCDAYLAFCYLGVKKLGARPTARVQRIWDNGTGRDRYWKLYLRRSGLSIIKKNEDRRIIIPEVRIVGEFDDLVRHPLTEEQWIVEFKTMNSGQFSTLHQPMPGHKVQVHSYMFAKLVQRSCILYENKDNQEVKVFQQHFDASLWNNLVARLQRVLDSLDNGIFPERTPMKNESWCPYQYICSHFEMDLEQWQKIRNS